jgi:hypothetical protein
MEKILMPDVSPFPLHGEVTTHLPFRVIGVEYL